MSTHTSIHHCGQYNYQINFGGTVEAATKNFEEDCVRRKVDWAHLFGDHGVLVASYSKTGGISTTKTFDEIASNWLSEQSDVDCSLN